MPPASSLAERVAKLEAMAPASDRDGRDQWDAINSVRDGVSDLKVQIGIVSERNVKILEGLEDVKSQQSAATTQRSEVEQRNAEKIDALTKKVDDLAASVAVLKDSHATMGKFGTVILSGVVSAIVGVVSWFASRALGGH